MKFKYILIFCTLFFVQLALLGQQKPIEEMTKEDVMELTYDELLELPFEDVLKLADIVGVSLDELYEMLLNKDVVSASKKVESSFEAPLSTSVISYDEIKASGARSVEEALRLVPGMIVREKTNGNFDVHIRGNDNLPANHMSVYSENSLSLIMIDGRPVYNYINGGTFWETLPIGLEDIERIEVVRGPSSALYGPNAVTGVVNVITKRPESQRISIATDVSGGTQSTALASFSMGQKINKKFSYRVSGNFETLNRNREELYVYKSGWEDGGYAGKFITKQELAVLKDPKEGNETFNVFDPADDVNDMYPDPMLARQRSGANGFLFYDYSEDIGASLKVGYQSSEILSTTFGDNPTSFAGRESNTFYVDLDAKIKGLHIQVNSLNGIQDIVKQDTGFKVDLQMFNANAEYDINVKGLNIRPGFFIQQAAYNDMPYLSYNGQGFLNGEQSLSSIAGSIRLDYTLFESLRLIGAIRGETYETIDEPYLSYQLIASYNLNDKHNIRFVHSRANRGPFLVDTYANYLWDREGRPAPSYIKFEGTENQDLAVMTMNELGYRIKPIKSIQADIELFHTNTKNFGALYPDSSNLNFVGLNAEPYVRMTFNNIDLESEQYGVSATISWVANEKMVIKAFCTWQRTKLKNQITVPQENTINDMLGLALFTYQQDVANPDVDVPRTHSTFFAPQKEDADNEATPSIYGGLIINYTPVTKLNINLNSYFYSKQTFKNKYDAIEIDPKVILNLKASYEIAPNLKAYINIHNLISDSQEFGFMDNIGSLFLLGLTYNLN